MVYHGRIYCHPEGPDQVEVLAALRDIFEASADRGYWTRMRRTLGGFGFYSLPLFALDNHKVLHYDELKHLPLEVAARKVAKQHSVEASEEDDD